MNIILHLPWPPTINNYYSNTRNGTFISKRGREYRKKVEEYVHEQLVLKDGPLEERLALKIILHPPDKRTRDIDNYNKSLLDAITHANVWEDDSLIDQLYIYRGAVIPGGSVIILIEEASMIIPVNGWTIIDKF